MPRSGLPQPEGARRVRIILDENIPVQLKAFLVGHSVKSVNDDDVGLKAVSNGKLLALIEGSFDVLITADKNIYAQQNLAGRAIAILVLPTNRRKIVVALAARILEALETISASEYLELNAEESQRR
jgi:predicted nuclease of predicted toxin-antitoxin system